MNKTNKIALVGLGLAISCFVAGCAKAEDPPTQAQNDARARGSDTRASSERPAPGAKTNE